MAKKKGKGKKGGKKKEKGPETDPETFLKNYETLCRVYGVQPVQEIQEQVVNGSQVVLSSLDTADCVPIFESFLGVSFGKDRGENERIEEAEAEDVDSPQKTINISGPYLNLESLRIWECSLDDKCVERVSKIFHRPKKTCNWPIKKLELLNCQVPLSGMKTLFRAFEFGQNMALEQLSLDYSDNLGSSGAETLFRAVRTNKALKVLSLKYCNIGSDNGLASDSAFEELKKLLEFQRLQTVNDKVFGIEELNLEGNFLGSKGFRAIMESLLVNFTLKKLHLRDNKIGREEDIYLCFEKLVEVLKVNKTLSYLDISENTIPQTAYEVLVNSNVLNGFAEGETEDVNKTLTMLIIDSRGVSKGIFKLLSRVPKASKKGKKGGKKKKKK